MTYLFWNQRQGRHSAVPLEIVLATVTALLSGAQHLEALPEVVCDCQRNCEDLLLIVTGQLFLFEELPESFHEVSLDPEDIQGLDVLDEFRLMGGGGEAAALERPIMPL